jgi:hypothetical protein
MRLRCWLVQIVKDLAGFVNILGKEIVRNIVGTMGLVNHEPCTPGVIAVAVFFLYGFQGKGPSFFQLVVEGAG